MCLGIPGEVIEVDQEHPDLAKVDVSGVRRLINIGLLADDPPVPGEWVLIHVGFALSKIDEVEAAAAMAFLEGIGQAYEDEIAALRESLIELGAHPTMRFVDEFRDAEAARALAAKIAALCEPGRQYKIMEVCGGHTHTIYKHGLEDYLPESITLVHGPGCPVCVIPMGRVDDAIALASRPGVIMTSFGDMMRVPGSNGSFFDAKASGTDIRMVYSPLDSLKIARRNPDRHVVFMAIGFETTAPSTAMTMVRAQAEGLTNFSVFCNHVTIVPAMKAILDSPDLRLDGFLGPGHVSTIIGCRPYEFAARDYGKPVVVAGFEPLDILRSIYMLMLQLAEGRCEVENQYSRVVPWNGNQVALRAIGQTMELRPYFEWRGLGFISHSALKVREAYAAMDAELRFELPGVRVADPKACQCGEVLKGVLKPWECKVFGTACTPETPIGTCMVSPEGACAAYYNFGRVSRQRVPEASGASRARAGTP